MSLRVLMATDFYPPHVGGLERQAQVVGHELRRRGHEVAVVTLSHPGMPAAEDDSGVTVHRFKALTTSLPWFSTVPGRRYHPPFPDPAMVWQLRRLIHRMRPDVVHARGWIAYSCAAALIGNSTPLVISAHDYGYICALRTLMRQGRVCSGPALDKCLRCAPHTYGLPRGLVAVVGVLGTRGLLRRKASVVHSISNFVDAVHRRHLLAPGEPGRPVSVMIPDVGLSGTGVVGRPAPPLRSRLPNEPFILFVGALTKNKGILPLIGAHQRLASPPPLVLIGTTWPDSPSTYPPEVKVLVDLPNAEVLEAFERCLFAVMPSIWEEPLGNVVIEAMLKGKAVVASKVGGIVDLVVDGETGLLVPPGDVPALAAAMKRLIDDPELRDALGKFGRARIRRLDASEVMPRFESLYEQLAAGGEALSRS